MIQIQTRIALEPTTQLKLLFKGSDIVEDI